MILMVVALALLDGEGRVLMQRRPDGKEHGGLWEFPGGKIESHEDAEEALVREIAEELGIAIAPENLFPLTFATSGAGAARPVVLLLYTCDNWQGEPVAEPGAAIVWCDRASLAELPMPPLDVPLAAAVTKMLK
ncbi:(deoxy)nucleoside triphosphate pyrophosphohydrolase [Novosphingobium sp. KCTC 2891]|uniref:(deoxy)nucleoside triphosphate pyrophosphohydrolase n=1 Tax=Novosphingobium sp. KCTC 2891 TaxID=2989730 RepID=UPI002221C0F5|nr:(deoxy)nucleoside triphosphate pyrophosphohydrolase [Novosphingobium sp. KCTC 2891]MCW1383485.1 (deoxy)nucleoside triphosphate pyrophosphohydrolase [Novosphingobium sp. KCTC 2891]